MTDEANLDARLRALEADGWRLRVCHTLRRPDRKDEVSWQSYHADSLEAVVKRVEQEVRTAPKRPVEPKLAAGWTMLEPVHPRPGESVYSASKIFPGAPKPVVQSSSTERGLLAAVESYERHKAGDAEPDIADPETARRLASSKVHTGLASTESHR